MSVWIQYDHRVRIGWLARRAAGQGQGQGQRSLRSQHQDSQRQTVKGPGAMIFLFILQPRAQTRLMNLRPLLDITYQMSSWRTNSSRSGYVNPSHPCLPIHSMMCYLQVLCCTVSYSELFLRKDTTILSFWQSVRTFVADNNSSWLLFGRVLRWQYISFNFTTTLLIDCVYSAVVQTVKSYTCILTCISLSGLPVYVIMSQMQCWKCAELKWSRTVTDHWAFQF